jgi:hypothetical protein
MLRNLGIYRRQHPSDKKIKRHSLVWDLLCQTLVVQTTPRGVREGRIVVGGIGELALGGGDLGDISKRFLQKPSLEDTAG